ncbi:MAG: hypothetical protein R3208_02385 [Ketobacteraceae bacterium]|nr:hypothetical protein [Ketobacteraceae bacterium]
MKAILRLYWQICRFRAGPEEVPPVVALAVLTLLAYAALNFLVRVVFGELSVAYSAISLAVITGFWGGLVYSVLLFKKLSARFLQTFTAALGTDVVLSVLSLPLAYIASQFPPDSVLVSLAAAFWLLIFIWDVLVKGFIFHRAFNVSPLLGNLFSLMMNLLIMMLDQSLLAHFEPEVLEQLRQQQQNLKQ